jgi:hypothetical protein
MASHLAESTAFPLRFSTHHLPPLYPPPTHPPTHPPVRLPRSWSQLGFSSCAQAAHTACQVYGHVHAIEPSVTGTGY